MIFPNPDALTRARFGAGLQTDIVSGGSGKMKELTFSAAVMLPENMEFRLFNSEFLLWVTRDKNGEPAIVFSAPYL